jgi:hypothetical protein
MALLDSGLAHARADAVRVLYRTQALTPEHPIPAPVHVWPASGGASQTLSLEQFNARYVVDYRFDLRRVPEEALARLAQGKE